MLIRRDNISVPRDDFLGRVVVGGPREIAAELGSETR